MTNVHTAARALINHWDSLQTADLADAEASVDALRQALEESPDSPTELVEPEPFGWLFNERDGNLYKLLRGKDVEWVEKNNPYWVKATPLYTAPPKREWVSLTDDEIAEIRRNGSHSVRDADFRAIEAKLKELNT